MFDWDYTDVLDAVVVGKTFAAGAADIERPVAEDCDIGDGVVVEKTAAVADKTLLVVEGFGIVACLVACCRLSAVQVVMVQVQS